MPANTGINDGGITRFYFDGIAAGFALNVSWTFSHTPRETTNKDNTGGRQSYLPGLTNATGTGEFYFAEDSDWNLENAFDAIDGRATVQWDYTSVNAGDINYTGTCYFTALTATSPNTGENETYSVSWQNTGTMVKQTQT